MGIDSFTYDPYNRGSSNNCSKNIMENVNTASNTEAPRRPRSFYGPGKFKWAIYPDWWPKRWGQKPLLGYVYADDEFYAEREAYNRGILTVNVTFKPEPVKLGPAAPRPPRPRNNFNSQNKE
jgi:hypothetical protein